VEPLSSYKHTQDAPCTPAVRKYDVIYKTGSIHNL